MNQLCIDTSETFFSDDPGSSKSIRAYNRENIENQVFFGSLWASN